MSVFTSVELLTSTYVSYRVGNVNVSLGAKGDTRRNCIRWDMKFFMEEKQLSWSTFTKMFEKNSDISAWKTSYLDEYSSA